MLQILKLIEVGMGRQELAVTLSKTDLVGGSILLIDLLSSRSIVNRAVTC